MSTNQRMCRIHNLQKAQFYISNQPWSRLCKQCALSRALCGYKIEKQLNSQQFQNKIIFHALVEELKNIISICDKKSDQYLFYADKLSNDIRSYLSQPFSEIDEYIKKITKIRDEIHNANLTYIETEIKNLRETQTNYFVESVKFKRLLQKLEGTFCEGISEQKDVKSSQQFIKQVNQIRTEIQNSRQIMSEELQKVVDIDQMYSQIKIQFQKIFKQFSQITSTYKFSYFGQKIQQKLSIRVELSTKDISNLNNDDKVKKNQLTQRTKSTHKKNQSQTTYNSKENSQLISSQRHKVRALTLKSARKCSVSKLKEKISTVSQ